MNVWNLYSPSLNPQKWILESTPNLDKMNKTWRSAVVFFFSAAVITSLLLLFTSHYSNNSNNAFTLSLFLLPLWGAMWIAFTFMDKDLYKTLNSKQDLCEDLDTVCRLSEDADMYRLAVIKNRQLYKIDLLVAKRLMSLERSRKHCVKVHTEERIAP